MAFTVGNLLENRVIAASLCLAWVGWVIALGGISALSALGATISYWWWTQWFVFFILCAMVFLLGTAQLERYRTPLWGYIIVAASSLQIPADTDIWFAPAQAYRAGVVILLLVFFFWIAALAPLFNASAVIQRPLGSGSEAPKVVNTGATEAPSATVGAAAAVAPSSDTKEVRARALFGYTANPADPHEISLEKDEVVVILDRKGNWWRARKEDGTLGIVPSNYMEVL